MSANLLSNDFSGLEDIRWSSEKCVRCNMCKFPPLARVESQAHSMGCPAYETFKFNANSGGGMVIMANSLLAGRSQVTDAVRDVVYGCTLCGLCDVSCKYNTDIEVLETLYLLRHRLHEEGAIFDAHRDVLRCIREHNHPFPALGETPNQLPQDRNTPGADTLVWAGPHFSLDPDNRGWARDMLDLLDAAGVRYQLLREGEPYSGRAALEIGDRELFRRQSTAVAEAIRASGARKVIALSAEDYSTLRSQTPKFAEIGVRVEHITETYADLFARRRLRPLESVRDAKLAWHDPCYLGRLGGRYAAWQGMQKKVGGMKVYEPRRPIDYGSGGVFDAPRKVLAALNDLPLLEFDRRREYAFNAGETGQAAAAMADFAAETADRRVQEARDCGIATIVTECPQAHASLTQAARRIAGVEVRSLTELVVESLARRSSS
jgi:Fe-S oxidoreductase